MVLLLWLGSVAWAGACCVGSTSGDPARVGECEHAVAGFSAGLERSTYRWDRDRQLQPSSMRDDALTSSLAAGYRINREWQLGMSAPARLNHRAAGDLDGWGGGLGDLRAQVLWDPLEEQPRLPDRAHKPVPIIILGVRLPTGRDWRDATGALQQDVTGLVGPGFRAAVSLERTLDRVPWSVGVSGELGLSDFGPQPSLALSGAAGRYFGQRWTAMLSASYRMAWADLSAEDVGTSSTRAGVQLIHGAPRRWRASLSASADLPAPGLGRSAVQHANLGVGALKVF